MNTGDRTQSEQDDGKASHQVLAAKHEQHKREVEEMTAKFQAVEHKLRADLTTRSDRIVELEKQLADAVKDKSASGDQLAALTSKTSNRIAELEKQLTDAINIKGASADQLAAL